MAPTRSSVAPNLSYSGLYPSKERRHSQLNVCVDSRKVTPPPLRTHRQLVDWALSAGPGGGRGAGWQGASSIRMDDKVNESKHIIM